MNKIKKYAIFIAALLIVTFFIPSCDENEKRTAENTPPLSFSFEKMSEEDAEIIIRLCHFETEGAPLLVKTAFCATILNRLESEFFPDTADGVVFEPGAFECCKKKSFYKDISPNELRRDRLALYYALEKEYDPTDGAFFCRRTDSADCSEITPSLTVGNYVFGNP